MSRAAHTHAELAAGTHAHEALIGVAAATLVLLFVGLHNAWDAVAWHVFVNLRKGKGGD